MDKIQLIFFFISGFLVSRLFIKVNLPQRVVYTLVGTRRLSLTTILLYMTGISALLSFFIPNVITVLTMLPILELFRRAYRHSGVPAGNLSTMLALSVIYGANIGGMGSITATPANGILVTYAALNDVPGTEYLTFASWLVWGIPLVICFVLLAWLILVAFFRPWRYQPKRIEFPFTEEEMQHPYQALAIALTVLFFLSSFGLSALMMLVPDWGLEIVIFTGILTLLFIIFLFLLPIAALPGDLPAPLLTIADCYSNLPMRGFLFVGIAIALAGILYLLEIDRLLAIWISQLIPRKLSMFTLLLLFALITSFTTEILSNTAVQVSMFIIAVPLSYTLGFPPLLSLIITTLSSTSAFMSPIATGVNGLAFGGVKGVSFLRMLMVGFVMNLAGALLISSWAVFFIGRMYGLL